MPSTPNLPLAQEVIPFDQFWKWLQGHPNCILRVGTADAVLYDHEDFHWHFDTADEANLLVEVLWGKQLIGEILLVPQNIAYVQCDAKGEEHLFECIISAEGEPLVAYHFVMSHAYDPQEAKPTQGRWVH